MASLSIRPAGTSPLDFMIAPLTRDAFFAQFYEQQHYRSPPAHEQVAALLSIDRIDEIISDSELPPSALSMAQSGAPVPAGEYTYASGIIDRGAVLDTFRNGATIVLPQLHFADARLYTFCLALEREFGARIQTNIYLTPPGNSGFGIHYDDHDVFVLQVAGRKTWEIYGQRDGLPYRGEGFRKNHDDTGTLRDTFVLEPGECLYVPRGLAHRAETEGDEASLHITVGILVQTWAEFMLEAVAEASLRMPELRQSLPRSLYFEESERPANEALFRRLMHEIADKASFEATLAAFGSNFVMNQGPRLRGALNALIAGVGEHDRLLVRESVIYAIEQGDDGPQLALASCSIPLAEDLAPQLAAKLAEGGMALTDFAVADAADLRDTLETLLAYGLLEKAG
jgi:bifunctional lysine-specific demethylase and histidyl-hydroxylase NO66